MEYSEIKNGLAQLAVDIAAERNRINSGKGQIIMADNNLAGFTAKYTALNTGIAAYLTANPTDASALLANAERLKMAAEFQALKTESAALVTAIGG